jgi:aspartyl-tRNA(Asn)/glutamyl-tRNA(Gln) amidotransferase subunit A
MSEQEIWRVGAAGLSAMLDAGSLTPHDILDVCLERHDRLNPAINAFAFVDREGARQAAEASSARQKAGQRLGPLDGIPVSVKDNLYVRGLQAEWGSELFRGHVPERDDLCVERLRAAGAVIFGKSATAEFALSGRTDTKVLGTTRNPWDLALSPGGSSGGAVASVAAGIVPLALGTDAGGSIRMPASYTGLVGLRPGNGRIARRYGFPPMAIDFQAIGLTARTVGDLDLLFGALSGPDRRDPVSLTASSSGTLSRPLRIGWFDQLGDDVPDDDVRSSHQQALTIFAALGHRVDACPPPFDIARLRQIWDTISSVGAARVALRYPDWQARVTEPLAAIVERGAKRMANDYVEALDLLQEFRAEISSNWGNFDVLVLPTAAGPAFPVELEHPAMIGGKTGSGGIQGMFCGWVNAVGYSGLSIPGHAHPDGRPIGIQLVARPGGDEVLIELARSFEAQSPWTDRWPALSQA